MLDKSQKMLAKVYWGVPTKPTKVPENTELTADRAWGAALNGKVSHLKSPLLSAAKCLIRKHMSTITTLGGRIQCNQCQAKSKRSQQQCRGPAVRTMNFCRMHSGKGSGPKTIEGRQRCAEAKTVHGFDTRKTRTDRAEAMRRLRVLEDLGHQLGIMSGPRTPGRKPGPD
jgi:hypothetical protein